MLKYFIAPNGSKLPVKDCLEKGLLDEYYPKSYLTVCAEERPWTGKPSTTQLLNGTRYAYLHIVSDYAIDPNQQAFRLIGTRAHKQLELNAPPESLAELEIPDDEISGIMDCLETQQNGDTSLYVEVDYKTWGSYKVVRALGMGTVKKTRPMVDSQGKPVLYQRDGKGFKKGDQKTETYLEPAENEPDMIEAELQLNRYRIAAEKWLKKKIDRMRIFVIVRDGGCISATQRGITRNTYYIDVKRLPDNQINEYFEKKRKALINFLENYNNDIKRNLNYFTDTKIDDLENIGLIEHFKIKNCPPPCTQLETWNGRRCNGYCAVSEICGKIGR